MQNWLVFLPGSVLLYRGVRKALVNLPGEPASGSDAESLGQW